MTSSRDGSDSSSVSSNRRRPARPRSQKPIDEQALYEYALGVLGRGMRTEAELRRLLKRRLAPATLQGRRAASADAVDLDTLSIARDEQGDHACDGSERAARADALIESVMARLRSHQYLSDTRYAAAYASLRREGRRLGARRVAHDLRSKGVPAEIITREVAMAYEGTTEEAQARAFLAKKRVAKPDPGSDRDKARILRMLARAGFSSTVAWKILRSWSAAPDEHMND
ncbi:MAG: RecX family transcriptional regulator [Myxococcales bacterium]|nr:RecX family transcriptional regulator [Myxococcales bacterium]